MRFSVSVHSITVAETLENLPKLWELELLGIMKNEESEMTQEELKAQNLQDEVTRYDRKSKTWSTSLLFKMRPPDLGPNKQKALGILKKVERSTIQKGVVDEVNKAFAEFLDCGFAEEVFEEVEPEEVHYLPGHAVFREESTSMKTRIVFNASAVSESGRSLNQCLHQGPCLLPDIGQILMRFRLQNVGFTLDISRMFLRIKLEHGKNFLRFFWRNCDLNAKVKVFRMTSVTFGVISSPFQAIDVVMKHAELFEKIFPRAVQVIRDQLYMDDVLGGAADLETAKATIEEIAEFFLEASMQPHKFASNKPEILERVPVEFRSPEKVHKVLGVLWNTETDNLLLKIKQVEPSEKWDTKRSFLEFSARIYDPLGLVSPFTTRVKLLFQQVWLAESEGGKKAKSWDEPLPDLIQEQWDEIKRDVPNLGDLSFPRCPFNGKGPPKEVEIFACGDASKKAYGTAIYLVGVHEDGEKTTHLALSKSRVAPLKMVQQSDEPQTIVRLELLAALITARAASYVRLGIEKHVKVSRVHFFTDSLINLCRIRRGPTKYKLWVANRVEEILNLSTVEQWHHCPGVLNPADLPSRGLSAEELKTSTLWWNGPDFIRNDESEWPKEPEIQVKTDLEVKKSEDDEEDSFLRRWRSLTVTEQKKSSGSPDWSFVCSVLNRFEDWMATVRHFARILRLGCRAHREKFARKPFSVEEKTLTEKFLWKLSQKQHFSKDYKSLELGLGLVEKSPLANYNPFFDPEIGLIKSNTRLVLSNLPESTRKAIILPRDCPVVAKLVIHQHKIHQHAGASYLHALLREEFLIPRGKQQIKKIVRMCVTRRCVKPVPLGQQEAPLPALRVDDPAPFRSVAVDLFGPMVVFHTCGLESCPHPREEKVHCALFTCFHSREVHLEVVVNTGTEAFLNAFRAFTARRGVPSTVYSDCAKGFKAADREIRALYRSINWSAVRREGMTKNIEWFFSTERAPHQNGLCERLVRTVKGPLRKVIGAAKLTQAQLTLILQEVEAVVNNRPLAVVSDDPGDLTPITPMELVNGRRLEQIPDPKAPKQATSFAHLWKQRQSILNQFWSRWFKEYLLAQSVRKIWQFPRHDDLMGKIVLVKDDNLSRNEWLIGRIIEILPSKDGLVRNVVVKTATSRLRRPVQKLSVFEQI